jgi:hypothetical protein
LTYSVNRLSFGDRSPNCKAKAAAIMVEILRDTPDYTEPVIRHLEKGRFIDCSREVREVGSPVAIHPSDPPLKVVYLHLLLETLTRVSLMLDENWVGWV